MPVQPQYAPNSIADTLNRILTQGGTSLMQAPGALASSFTSPPTAQEQKQGGIPANPNMLQKLGLGLDRNIGQPIQNAAEWYGRERALNKSGANQGVGTIDKMLSVAPEAMGQAGAGVAAGGAMGALGDAAGGASDFTTWTKSAEGGDMVDHALSQQGWEQRHLYDPSTGQITSSYVKADQTPQLSLKEWQDSAKAGKAAEAAPPTPQWPAEYANAPKTFSNQGGGGANYTAADLAALKAKYGLQ